MFDYDWDWAIVWQYKSLLMEGVAVTLELTLLSILIGTVLGTLCGTLLASKNPQVLELQLVVFRIVDIVRALPVLILILLLNYWGPYLIGIREPFWLSVVALSLNLAAFVADNLRGAITGVPRPYTDAGRAIGMTELTLLFRIILPEAFRNVIPTMFTLYIDILKQSSLASVITVGEMTRVARVASTYTFRFLEFYAALAFLYIIIVLLASWAQRRLEVSKWFLRRS